MISFTMVAMLGSSLASKHHEGIMDQGHADFIHYEPELR